MKLGVKHTVDTLESVSELVLLVCDIVKHGMSMSALLKISGIINKITDLVKNAPELWPELQDLDVEEARQLGEVSYVCAKKIAGAIKK